MSDKTAIQVKNVTKIYKLYRSNKDRFLETFGFSKKKRYHEHYALNDVSFDVKKGETVGIIGTNGAGKSTILKIITGVLTPTSGEVKIDGRISALLELGAGFNMEYSGIENIYLNGTMNGYSREEVEQRIPAILEFADIGDFVYQPVKTYSSGMFVRLAFALAVNIDPEILVVDEALSVGDVFFQSKCYRKFEEFKKEGKTILLVSHDMGSIAKYCDRVILLNKGEKLTEGDPKEIVNLYKKMVNGSDEDRAEILRIYGRHQEKQGEGQAADADKSGQAGAAAGGQATDGQGAADGVNAADGENASSRNASGENAGNGEAADANGSGSSSGAEDASGTGRTKKQYSVRDSVYGDGREWKEHFEINPDLNEYGNHKAELIDFAVFDEHGLLTSTIMKGTKFTIKSKVRFNEDIPEPIFTYTFKTIRGQDVTGTNTMYEDKIVPMAHKGDIYVASFTQQMDLQGGWYLLSLSCTGYVNDELVAYHRCYDLIAVDVVSTKNTVGFYDMNSVTTVTKVDR